jgi:hypothetical protein
MLLSGFAPAIRAPRIAASKRRWASSSLYCSLSFCEWRAMSKSSSTWDRALAPFRPLIIAQGEVAYAYNLLQENFFAVFNLAMALERPRDRVVTFYPYALAIWHVSRSDRQQRELALAALANLPTTLNIKGGIDRLQWAEKQTEELAKYRNLIVHSPMKFSFVLKDGKMLTPSPRMGSDSTKPIDRRRLRLIENLRFWKGIRNDLLNLSDYVDFVCRQIAWREYEQRNGAPIPGARRAWPRRPKLPSVHQIYAIRKTIDRQAEIAPSGGRRRRPSGGPPRGKS